MQHNGSNANSNSGVIRTDTPETGTIHTGAQVALQRSVDRRHLAGRIFCVCPSFSVLIMLIYRGGRRLSWDSFTALPPTAFEVGGGFGNAIVGTLLMVGIAIALSVPLGILAAVSYARLPLTARSRT